jgi:nucleotide-binding universal stress UspA family protein
MHDMAAQPRKIMVAYDDSEAARRALDRAADLTGYGSSLTVVSVASQGGRYQAGPLDQAREQLVRRQVTATYLQPVGEPAAELVEAARELDADLVVLGRRSRSLRRLVLGSVSATVVRRAPCDVLVVR